MWSNDEQTSSQSQRWNQVNPWNPIAAIARCWRWALPTGIVLAGATTFVIASTFVPMYRANCLVSVNTDYLAFKNVKPVIRDLAKSEKSLIQNPIVLAPVLMEAGVREAPSLSDPKTAESNLRKNLSVTKGGSQGTMIIAYEDTDGAAAAQVCNAVVESYLRQRDTFDSKRESNLEQWLEPEIQRWELEVSKRKRDLEALSNMLLVYVDPTGAAAQAETELKYYKTLVARVQDVTLNLESLDAQIKMLNAKRESESEPQPPYSGDSQESVQAATEMSRKRDLMAAELQVLRRNLDEEKSKLEQYGSHAAKLQFAQDEYAVANAVLGKLRGRVAQLRTERQQDGAVRLIAPAITPRTPINKMPLIKAGWCAAVAFVSPFLLGYLFGFAPRPQQQPVESNDEND